MTIKRLLPLVMLFLVLIVAALVFKRQPASVQLVEEAGLVRLVPQTLRAESVTGFDVYQGMPAQSAVRVRKRDGAWVVASHFDAPGSGTKIQELLGRVSTLQGELRSEDAALLGDFRLDDAQALHVQIYTESAETPTVHLLAGKGSGRSSFMRRAGETRVYSVDLNLHATAGLHSGTTDQTPTARPWLELHILNLPPEQQVTALELHTPTQNLHFARQAATPSGTESSGAPGTPAWSLVSPALSYVVKQSGVDGMVSSLRTLQGDDIVDPAHLATYGLETPTYHATFTVQPSGQETRQMSLLVGHEAPEQQGKRYVRLGASGPVYLLAQYAWQRLFPALGAVLELTLLQVPADEVTRVTVQQDGNFWTLARREASTTMGESTTPAASAWQLLDAPDRPVDEAAVTSLLTVTQRLNADDFFTQAPAQTGLDDPPLALTLMPREGRTIRLSIGQALQDNKGYYASVEDTPGVFVIPTSIHQTITESLTKLRSADIPTTAGAPAVR